MNLALWSVRNRLIALFGALALVGGAALLEQLSLATIARLILGLAAAAGLVWWWSAKGSQARFEVPKRLEVVQRVGLAARTGLALVEIDGQPYLVVHGEGFAQVQRTRTPAKALR